VDLLTESLLALGVLSGDLKELVASGAYRKYYPHGVGHYLGLDVHDAGIYQERGRDFQLQPGMVLTNEPGLYFRDPGPYSGIGIRIEEDILVTETGSEVLTAGLPRTIEEIESVRSGGVWP
jgi:Xaa-Pro aminopeptidase